MEIKVGFEIAYAAVQLTLMVTMLNIHPSRFADIVGTESIVADPNVPIASIATASALSAAGWWRRRAA